MGDISGDQHESIQIQDCSELKNVQTELSYLDYFKTYSILLALEEGTDGWGMSGHGGVPTHGCTCMHTHAYMLNMVISCK